MVLERQGQDGTVTTRAIPCDTLVCAVGVHPDEGLTQSLTELGIEAVSLGNCAQAGPGHRRHFRRHRAGLRLLSPGSLCASGYNAA